MRLPPSSPHAPGTPAARLPFPASENTLLRVLADLRTGVIAGFCILAVLLPAGAPTQAKLSHPSTDATAASVLLAPPPVPVADLAGTLVSDPVKRIANWSAATRNHAAQPFVIVDKQSARLYVFDASARLQAHTAVLVGSALGDLSAPGIGDKPIAAVLPEERTTPAGRFNGQIGRNLTGEQVVWVDYDAAVSMHRVRAHQPAERRLQRLASETTEDNRISYGCINVPADFFDAHLLPVFSTVAAAIYVLPDYLSLEQVFGPLP